MWEDKETRGALLISVPTLKSSRLKAILTNLLANLISGLIISPTEVLRKKRSRSVDYSSNSSISSTLNYSSSVTDSGILTNLGSSSSNSNSEPTRLRYKLNSNTITYYYRCLGHSRDIR